MVGGYLALSYAPPFLAPIMGSMPTNEESLLYEAPDEFTKQIDEHIKNHKVAQAFRANPEYVEARHHAKIPEEVKSHHLTAGSLAGPDMLAVPPLFFGQKDGKSMICIFYVGQSLCGHPGIVHGGFLATMLDEGLAFCAFPALPNKVGVTAQLNISYKKPTMAGQYLALIAQTTKVEGRKAWASGGIVPLDDIKLNEDGSFSNEDIPMLVSAEALFIEPKYASVSCYYTQHTERH